MPRCGQHEGGVSGVPRGDGDLSEGLQDPGSVGDDMAHREVQGIDQRHLGSGEVALLEARLPQMT